jgi:hypothetical protein
MAMGYWGGDITGELVRSQRWAGPDKLIGGVFDVIAAYKLDAAKRREKKRLAQGLPPSDTAPASRIMRDMHFGAQLGWEREEGERAGKLSDATALLRLKARLDEEQEERQMARMRAFMGEGMGPEAATTQSPEPRLEAPPYPAPAETPEREVPQGLYPESVRPGMSQSIFDVVGRRAAGGLPLAGGAPRAFERQFLPEPGGSGAVFRPPPLPPLTDAFRGAGTPGGVLPSEAAASGVAPAAQAPAAVPVGAPGGGSPAPDLNRLRAQQDFYSRAAMAAGMAGNTKAQVAMARNASLVGQTIEAHQKQQLEVTKKMAVADILTAAFENRPDVQIITEMMQKYGQVLTAGEIRANLEMINRMRDQRLSVAERANTALALVDRIKPTKEGFMRMRIHTPDLEREWVVNQALKVVEPFGMEEEATFLRTLLPKEAEAAPANREPDLTTKSGVKVWKQSPAP